MPAIQISKVDSTRKTNKTFPKSSLRKTARVIKGVRDPAKSPPFKPGMLHILTPHGEKDRKKKLKHTLRNMPDQQVRKLLSKSKINVSDAAPAPLAKLILESGADAGMISL